MSDGNRYFLSPAYLKLVETGLYGLFRDMLEEQNGRREKLKTIGPIGLLREVQEGETVHMKTVCPQSGRLLLLTRAS